MRSLLYKLARLLGDINAICKGRVKQRIERRVTGKITSRLLRLFFCLIMAGCGSGTCEGVDTSRAPDSIIHGPAGDTYTWGGCSITYSIGGSK